VSGWRYCDDTTPHEMHEWVEDITDAWMGETFTQWWHCAGVKDTPELRDANAAVVAAERNLSICRGIAADRAMAARYTEDEAMHYTPDEENTNG